jgi:hypothetical protein
VEVRVDQLAVDLDNQILIPPLRDVPHLHKQQEAVGVPEA